MAARATRLPDPSSCVRKLLRGVEGNARVEGSMGPFPNEQSGALAVASAVWLIGVGGASSILR